MKLWDVAAVCVVLLSAISPFHLTAGETTQLGLHSARKDTGLLWNKARAREWHAQQIRKVLLAHPPHSDAMCIKWCVGGSSKEKRILLCPASVSHRFLPTHCG